MILTVAFLAYNNSSAPYLADFLPSLGEALQQVNAQVNVLAGDNSDHDFKLNEIQISEYFANFSGRYEYLDFGENLGFAAAYNRLINRANDLGSEYFLMLNPDMIFDKNLITELLSALKLAPQAGSASPKIYYWDFVNKKKTMVIDSCGIVMKPGLRFSDLGQGEEDDGKYNRASILGPSGAAALFRVSALEKIKLGKQYFDENFFMYKEDCDLIYRLAKANYQSILAPRAIAYHDRSLSLKRGLRSRINDWQRRSKLTRYWSFKGQHLLYLKHWSSEGFISRLIIIVKSCLFFLFSLLFANFLLKTYKHIFKTRGLD